jgi:very-short-patch-repair endonuclease
MKQITLDANDFVPNYLAGESILKIAERYGVSRQIIRKYLTESGIPIRHISECTRLHWGTLTTDERRHQVAAAHRSTNGRKMSTTDLAKAAIGRQFSQSSVSDTEIRFAKLLIERGCAFTPQLAIGPYNCDFAIYPVAVEIFGGAWHWYGNHLARTAKRFRYIMDQGWHVLVVTDYGGVPINDLTADYAISYIETARLNPSGVRQYRVIRGAGQFVAGGSADDDEISIVPAFTARRNSLGQYESVPR